MPMMQPILNPRPALFSPMTLFLLAKISIMMETMGKNVRLKPDPYLETANAFQPISGTITPNTVTMNSQILKRKICVPLHHISNNISGDQALGNHRRHHGSK